MRANAAVLIASLTVMSAAAQQAPPAQTQPPVAQPPPPAPRAMETVPNCPELATALTNLSRNDARIRDWPQLGRYREQNRQLAPASGSPRVVFMGDSITDAWPMRVSDFFAGKAYVGRGIGGQTTPQMLIRFRRDVIDLEARVVVILAGTNDIAGNTGAMSDEEIQGNIKSMAELAKAHGIRVVLSRSSGQRRIMSRRRHTADDSASDDAHPRVERLDEEIRRRRETRYLTTSQRCSTGRRASHGVERRRSPSERRRLRRHGSARGRGDRRSASLTGLLAAASAVLQPRDSSAVHGRVREAAAARVSLTIAG